MLSSVLPFSSITAGLVLGLGLLFGCAPVGPEQGQASQAAEVKAGEAKAAEAGPEPATEVMGWTDVPDLAALRAAAEAAGDHPVAIELSAAWCLPCRELAKKTLADGAVVKRLAGTAKITVDVTDGTDAQVDIQARLDAQTLPHLVIYRSGSELVGVLADEPKATEPAVRVQAFVTAAELIGRLDAAGL